MATAYDPITAAGNGQHQHAEGIAVRRFHPSGAASPAATVERDEGVKMHSWLTMNAPWAVRMIAPETVTVVPAAARMAPVGHGDPARDAVDRGVLGE